MPTAFYELFEQPLPVIAVIHTGPSPGSPGFYCMESVVDRALAEATIYAEAGVDGLLLKNLHDLPCVPETEMGPEVAAFMTRVAHSIKHAFPDIPLGVQVMCGASRTSIAVALAAGCDFVRVDSWEQALEGQQAPGAGSSVRYRHHIRAEHIPAFADVDVAHTNSLSPIERAEMLAWHRANALVLTGGRPGRAPDLEQVRAIKERVAVPVIVGSGMTRETIADYFPVADGFIIGSAFKEHGIWNAPVCQTRAHDFMHLIQRMRRKVAPSMA